MGVFRRKIESNGKTSQYWYIRYSVNGKDKWESVGKVGVVTKTFAQKVLNEKKRLASLEKYDQLGAKIPTLQEFEDEYITHIRDVKQNRSWMSDVNHLKHLQEMFAYKKLSNITPGDIDDY